MPAAASNDCVAEAADALQPAAGARKEHLAVPIAAARLPARTRLAHCTAGQIATPAAMKCSLGLFLPRRGQH